MRAWRFPGPSGALELTDVPDPAPAPGWVVLDVKASGLCHSDVHIVDGPGRTFVDKVPITLGHEVAGTIAALGQGVTGFEVGQPVGVALLSQPADQRRARVRSAPGIAVDGGHAERCAVHASTLVAIPDGVDFAAAAVATDAIATGYHAVRSAGNARAGQTVGIVGLGGLGLSGLRTAALLDCNVYGVDINNATFDHARAAGALECFTEVGDLAALRPDLIVDFAGVGATTSAALQAVRPGGRVILVGLGATSVEVPAHTLVTTFKTLRGSLGATKDDLRRVYGLLACGDMAPVLEEVPFTGLRHAFDRLRLRDVRGRLFTRPTR